MMSPTDYDLSSLLAGCLGEMTTSSVWYIDDNKNATIVITEVNIRDVDVARAKPKTVNMRSVTMELIWKLKIDAHTDI